MSASCKPREGCTSEDCNNPVRTKTQPSLTILYTCDLRALSIALTVFSIFGSSSDSLDWAIAYDPVRSRQAGAPSPPAPGDSNRWEIRSDSTAPSRPNVIAHIGGPPADAGASLAIFDNSVCYDGDLFSVKFKTSGRRARLTDRGNRLAIPGCPQLLPAAIQRGREQYRTVPHSERPAADGIGGHRQARSPPGPVVHRQQSSVPGRQSARAVSATACFSMPATRRFPSQGRTGICARAAAVTVYFDDFPRIDRKG